METLTANPCLACGACCAFFRASFYWAETDMGAPEGVPFELVDQLSHFRCCMKGTRAASPRCVALMGIIGKQVHCAIYTRRASVCREFNPSWQDGLPNERCDRARAQWGLAPLSPHTWMSPTHFPSAA